MDMLLLHILSCALALFHLRNMKFVQNLPLQHVARSSTCWTSWDMLLGQILYKFNPATCPVSVYLTRFCLRYILQQHVPATCPLVWAHLNVILMLDNEFRKSFPDYRGLIIKIKFKINQIAIIATLVQLHWVSIHVIDNIWYFWKA